MVLYSKGVIQVGIFLGFYSGLFGLSMIFTSDFVTFSDESTLALTESWAYSDACSLG